MSKRMADMKKIPEEPEAEPELDAEAMAKLRQLQAGASIPMLAKLSSAHPYRVRACFVLRGTVVSSYEAHDNLKDAMDSAKDVKSWKVRAPSANGAPMQLSQIDVDKLDGAVWKLQQRKKVLDDAPTVDAKGRRVKK